MPKEYQIFKDRVIEEKCGGVVTKEKLLKFIANYNKLDSIFAVVIESGEVKILMRFTNIDIIKYPLDCEGLLKAMYFIFTSKVLH